MGPEMVSRNGGLGTSSALGYLARSYPGRSLAVSACLLGSGLLEGIGISTVLPLINLVVRGSLESTGALGSAVERLYATGMHPGVSFVLRRRGRTDRRRQDCHGDGKQTRKQRARNVHGR